MYCIFHLCRWPTQTYCMTSWSVKRPVLIGLVTFPSQLVNLVGSLVGWGWGEGQRPGLRGVVARFSLLTRAQFALLTPVLHFWALFCVTTSVDPTRR